MHSAFPTLFPYSKADFDMPRSHTVTLAAYAKYMLKYKDSRFGRHPLFHYYVFNRIIGEQALNATRFYSPGRTVKMSSLSFLFFVNGRVLEAPARGVNFLLL